MDAVDDRILLFRSLSHSGQDKIKVWGKNICVRRISCKEGLSPAKSLTPHIRSRHDEWYGGQY